MASVVDICNLALAHIAKPADVTAIDPPDGTAEADHCARFYPIARNELLERHDWRFATRRVTLEELATNPQEALWAYAYGRPNLAIRILAVLLPESTDDAATQKFVEETNSDGSGIIYTHAQDAQVRFVWLQEDTTKYTPLFVVALSWKLAEYLAGPLTKDPKIVRACAEMAEATFMRAAAADAPTKLTRVRDEFTPGHIAARNA